MNLFGTFTQRSRWRVNAGLKDAILSGFWLRQICDILCNMRLTLINNAGVCFIEPSKLDELMEFSGFIE